MTTITQLAAAMQTVLTVFPETVARSSGFTRRRSKCTAARFVQTLVFGWLALPSATLENLAQTAAARGLPITPQGLTERFTPAAATLLRHVLAAAVARVITAEPALVPLLQRFTAVLLLDSTTILLPAALATVWPGCGGTALLDRRLA